MAERKTTKFHKPKPGRSLGELFPELVEQWHPTLNEGLGPFDVVPGTHHKIWWVCDKGPDHVWQAMGNARTSKNTGCPFCNNNKVSVTNSLANFPELVAQFHPTLNGDLKPEQLVATTNQRLWWKCPEGPDHVWAAKCHMRVYGYGCPFCAGHKASVTNRLSNLPELAAQFHPTLNGDLTPETVVVGTARQIWWKCPEGTDHEWQAPGYARMKGFRCPFCARQKVSVTNSLANFPEMASQWHPTRNGDLTPDDVVAGTMRKTWWLCPENPQHEWRAAAGRRLEGKGCPYCVRYGYDMTKSGALYVLCGVEWGKVGVSNILDRRLKTHFEAGVFSSLVSVVHFVDGRFPAELERNLLKFIAGRTDERAPKVDGYTESFPVRLLGDVRVELSRLLVELSDESFYVCASDSVLCDFCEGAELDVMNELKFIPLTGR